MSFRDSVIVAAQTLISNGFGASVGLEAGYTQLAAGIASKLGSAFRLRRADQRMLVGCGAAAAIAAAFGAPLTGAFYGFELIIGTYTVVSLAPVLTAAVVATLVSHSFGVEGLSGTIGQVAVFKTSDLPTVLVLALRLCRDRHRHYAWRDAHRAGVLPFAHPCRDPPDIGRLGRRWARAPQPAHPVVGSRRASGPVRTRPCPSSGPSPS